MEAQADRGTDVACSRQAAPSQHWPRQGLRSWSLSSSSCQLRIPAGTDYTRSLAWRCDLFCTPIACEGTSQLTGETSEHFTIVLA